MTSSQSTKKDRDIGNSAKRGVASTVIRRKRVVTSSQSTKKDRDIGNSVSE